MQLSSLYGAALRGSESAWGTYNDLRTHLDKVNSPYAMQVRGKLEATTDAQLLARVGSVLTRPKPSIKDPAVKQALDQVRALGVRYLERALELDPNLESAKATLVRMQAARAGHRCRSSRQPRPRRLHDGRRHRGVRQEGHGCWKTAARRGEGPRGRGPEDGRSARRRIPRTRPLS